MEGVSLQPEEDASIPREPCFTVPFDRDPDFVNRPDIMAWMKEQYTCSAGRIALVGIGGFGYLPQQPTRLLWDHHAANTPKQIAARHPIRASYPRYVTANQRLLGARKFEAEVRGGIPAHRGQTTAT